MRSGHLGLACSEVQVICTRFYELEYVLFYFDFGPSAEATLIELGTNHPYISSLHALEFIRLLLSMAGGSCTKRSYLIRPKKEARESCGSAKPESPNVCMK